jgi:hypothetical protein
MGGMGDVSLSDFLSARPAVRSPSSVVPSDETHLPHRIFCLASARFLIQSAMLAYLSVLNLSRL